MAVAVGVAVKAIGTWVASNFTWAAVAKAVILSAVSYGIQRLTAPSVKGALDPGITQTLRNPTAPRRVIYGKRRVGGVLVYAGTTDDDNLVHLIIALAGHEVESISDIYLNDKPLADFDLAGQQKEVDVTWTALAAADTSVDVTVNGTLYSGSISTLKPNLAAAGYIVSGSSVITGREGEDYKAHLHITVATVPEPLVVTSTAGGVSTYAGETYLYRVNTHLGTTAQTHDTDAVAEIAEWTIDHRLRGVAYVYVRLRFDREAFPSGIPNVTALVSGKNNIYDPRDLSSGYSTNAALCFADYLASDQFGFGASFAADFDLVALNAAANICDEAVVLDDSSSESRYSCNGVVDTDQSPKSVLERLLTAMCGTCVFSGGKWVVHAGAYRSATVTLAEADLRAGFTVQTKPSRADLCNAVKGTYTYRADDDGVYQPADFPAVTNSTYQAEDGEQIWRDIELQFTSSPSMAQRLAKIELEKTRQGMTLRYPCKLTALGIRAGDVVQISNTRLDWTAKPFEVLEWEFAIDAGGALGIDLTLQETAAGVYDWANGEETTVDLAPNTNLPNPYAAAAVTNLVVVESAIIPTDGGQVINIAVSWDAAVNRNIILYELEGRIASDTTWHSASTTGTNYLLSGIAAGYGYFVRVRAVNIYGKASPWNEVSFYADGITETPWAPSALTLIETTDNLTAVWTNNIPANQLAYTEIWAATDNNRGAPSFVLVDKVVGNRASYQVASGTFYVWLKAVDRYGNESDWFPASATAGVAGTPKAAGGLSAADQTALDAASDLIAGISDDNILSIAEKRVFDEQYNREIIQDYARIVAGAAPVGLDSGDAVYSNYTLAATGVTTLMGPLLADMTTESAITRSSYNATWNTYFETRQLLLNAIYGASLDLGANGDIDCDNIDCDIVTCTGINGTAVYTGGSYTTSGKVVGITTAGVIEIGSYIDFHYSGTSDDRSVRLTGFTGGVESDGYIKATAFWVGTTQIAFTGGHISYSDTVINIGDIITVLESAIVTPTQTFQKVKVSESSQDKRVLGVVAENCLNEDGLFAIKMWCSRTSFDGEDTEDELVFLNQEAESFYNYVEGLAEVSILKTASIGEGGINVCSEGGNIDSGDYICSSSTPGKGMLQDDDLQHNYTVAKSLEDVTWTAEEITNNITKMIACTYHCG